MSDVTQIVFKIESGDASAVGELFELVYDELRKLAAIKLGNEVPNQTLQPTALVHEAFLRLVDTKERQHWDSPGHFFSAAAEAMRRILVDRARAKQCKKRGGDRARVSLEHFSPASVDRDDEIIAVHDALKQLQDHDAQAAELVKLRYFAGLNHQKAAAMLGISRRQADRLWAIARAWLFREIKMT